MQRVEKCKKTNVQVAQNSANTTEVQKTKQTVRSGTSVKSVALGLSALGLFAVATAYMTLSRQSADLCPTTSCMLNGFQ